MARAVRIADVTPRLANLPNLLDATIPGLSHAQVARIVATYNDRQEHIAIVFSTPGKLLDLTAAEVAVRAHLGDFHLGFVDNHGEVVDLRITGSPENDLAFIIAAAAAVLQRSWGWDESPIIKVRTGDRSFRFVLQYNGNRTHTATERLRPWWALWSWNRRLTSA